MVMVWTSLERRLARPSRDVHALFLARQERLDSKHLFAYMMRDLSADVGTFFPLEERRLHCQ